MEVDKRMNQVTGVFERGISVITSIIITKTISALYNMEYYIYISVFWECGKIVFAEMIVYLYLIMIISH